MMMWLGFFEGETESLCFIENWISRLSLEARSTGAMLQKSRLIGYNPFPGYCSKLGVIKKLILIFFEVESNGII